MLFPWVVTTVLAMVLVVAIIVGWSIIFPLYNAAAFNADEGGGGGGLWILMGLGHAFLSLVLVALAWFLAAMMRRQRLLHLQDAFIDTVTHELRTPLAGLRLGVETLQRQSLEAEARGDCLRRMHGDLERLQAFIDHLIEANRLAHGRRAIRRDRFDLAELLSACRERISSRYDLAGPWCEIDAPGRCIIGERTAFETIVLNLLDNAVKYAQGRPEVELQARLADDRCQLQVCDRGLGFPPDRQRQLFRRFVRLPETENGIHGSGLGLYILAELCRQLGGSYSARSEGPGRGACFTVALPIELPQEQHDDEHA